MMEIARDMEVATRITGPCSCHEAYKSRGLIAPDCAFHEYAHDIADELDTECRAALEEAIRAVGLSAWKHAGSDAYSQGMDAGATHQLKACLEAVRALLLTDATSPTPKGQDSQKEPT